LVTLTSAGDGEGDFESDLTTVLDALGKTDTLGGVCDGDLEVDFKA